MIFFRLILFGMVVSVSHPRTEPGLGVRGGRSINKKNFEIPNKHSFNKPSTKKNTQNYFFLDITMQLFMKMEFAVFLNLQNHL